MSAYSDFFVDGIGDFGTGNAPSVDLAEFGPLSPEQLSKLNRPLTDAEQKAVRDWESQQTDAMLAAERAKGGPRSSTVSVTEKGAVLKADPAMKREYNRIVRTSSMAPISFEGGFWSQPLWQGSEWKRWHGAVGGLAAVAVAAGLAMVLRKK